MPRGKRAGAPTKPKQTPKASASKKKVEAEAVRKRGAAAPAPKPEPAAAPKPRGRPPAVKPEPLTEQQHQALFHANYRRFKRFKTEIADRREELAGEVGAYREWLKERRREGNYLEQFETALKIEADQGRAIAARWEMERRVAGWMGGAEQLRFDFVPDRKPAVDKAHEEGRAACYAGVPRHAPYPVSTEQERAWYAGYDEGQEVLLKGFKAPMAPEEPAAEPPAEAVAEQHQNGAYVDGQADANGTADGRPVGSVPVDGDINAAVDAVDAVPGEPVTSGVPITRSAYEASKDDRPRHLQQRDADAAIGTEMPTHETVQ